MKVRRLARALFLLTLLLPAHAAAQAGRDGPPPPPLVLSRISGDVRIDGRLDGAEWAEVPPLPAHAHSPVFGAEPSQPTEFRVAYDDRYLYFSCRALDSDRDGLRASSLKRDDGSFANDWCVINLDTFNDKETALVIGTNPAGIRTDVAFANDATTPPNFSWNTFWDAAVQRDAEGWTAEIRIPFSSLRFQNEPGTDRVVMGMALWRRIARTNEMITFPAISPQWGTYSFAKASQFREVVLTGISSQRPVYVTPYALGGVGRTNALDDARVRYRPEDERVHDAGLDLKLGVSSNATLDVTFNTDFAQVEADDQQVNLTRFSLFFPEKRLFFQERGSVFEYGLGGNERLFHSRRIGLVEGTQVPIYAGARFIGRMGEWDVGILDMQTGAAAGAPGENLGVLRLRRRVLNANSYLGGIVTSRIADGGGQNVVYAVDALVRVWGQDYVTLNWGQAFDEPEEENGGAVSARGPGALARALARLLWERRGQDGLTYMLGLTRAGSAFEPGLGYLQRRDYSSYSGTVGYGWRSAAASPLLRHTFTLPARAWSTNADGPLETVEIQPTWVAELKSGRSFTVAGSWTYENLGEAFSIGDASVPAGLHRFATVRIQHTRPDASLFGVGASLEAGGYYDGRVVSASISPGWNASRHLTLNATYRYDDIRFPDRGKTFRAHIARVRTLVMADSRMSLAGFIQYTSAADLVSANLRLRFNPSEGHDLYVVWNQGLNTDRRAYDPVRPLNRQATLLVKYSRTWVMGM